MVKPLLVFAYGNPSRGDDALGPALLEELQHWPELPPEVELLSDFQLQIEHALDLEGRRWVVFADASAAADAMPFAFERIRPVCDQSYSTHAMSPAALLQVYCNIKKAQPPPCFLLSIGGENFALGEPLSMIARANLRAALTFSKQLLSSADLRKTSWTPFSDFPIMAGT